MAIAATAGAASPAQASDASLRKAVTTQESRVDAQSLRFAKASTDLVSAVGRERGDFAALDLRTAVTALRRAVVRQKASTDRVRRLRTQYLTAVTATQAGLATYERGRQAFDPDSPARAATLYKQAKVQLKAAGTRRDRAAVALGARP